MAYYNPYYPNNGAMPDMLNQLRGQQMPMQQPMQMQQPAPQPQSNGIVWVQGESAAKSFPVAPNTTVMLLDSESSVFYLKTSDASGMPLPLRVFDYKERTQNPSNLPVNAPKNDCEVNFDNFVTYDKLDEILASLPINTTPKKTEKKTKGDTENG
jgi:hypothetical protein